MTLLVRIGLNVRRNSPPTLGEEGLLCFHIVFGQNTKVFRVSTRGRQLLGTMYRGKCLGFAVLQTIL